MRASALRRPGKRLLATAAVVTTVAAGLAGCSSSGGGGGGGTQTITVAVTANPLMTTIEKLTAGGFEANHKNIKVKFVTLDENTERTGLQSQGDEILEAARVDGARAWQIFRSLTLPHLRPYIELGVLLGSIYIVQAFDGVYMITQGGPSTDSTNLPYYIYRVGFTGSLNIGRASAMSVVVVAATILIATLALRMVSSLFSDEGMRSR